MIAKKVYKFCCEDISLIENYKQAIADKTQVWHCHHRKETDDGFSRKKLIKMGLYFNRPANELIFLTNSEHITLHNSKRTLSEETKNKKREAQKNKCKKVYQYTKDGIFLKEYPSMKNAEKTLGFQRVAIDKCCKGLYKQAYGYIWRYYKVKKVFDWVKPLF